MQIDRASLLACLDEWGRYVGNFQRLDPRQQAAFLLRQGYPRFGDVLAHVTAWWDEGLQVVQGVCADAAYVYPEPDTDEFNARVVDLAQGRSEADLIQRFEAARLNMSALIADLPPGILEHRLVQEWLRADVIEHLQEHRLP